MTIMTKNLITKKEPVSASDEMLTEEASRKKATKLPSIPEFYKNRSILFVGDGGLLGKLITLKLLKSCPDIKKIYFMIYLNPYVNVRELANDFRADPIFKNQGVNLDKLDFFIEFDDRRDFLKERINSRYITALKEEISVIFYITGSTPEEREVMPALEKSFFRLRNFVKHLSEMKALEAFMYISTAFADNKIKDVPEKEVPIRVPFETYFKAVPNIIRMRYKHFRGQKYIKPYKTVSIYGKKLGESYLSAEERKVYPIGIVRTGMLTAAIDEPSPGYIRDNSYLNGIVLLTMYDFLHKVEGNPDSKLNIVPIDLAVNAIIVSACDVAQRVKQSSATRIETPIFYNFVTTEGPRAITWKDFECYLNTEYNNRQGFGFWRYWSNLSIEKNKYFIWLYNIVNLFPRLDFYHLSYFYINEQNDLHGIKAVHYLEDFIKYFSTTSWNYENENVCSMWDRLSDTDKETFNFVKFFLTLRRNLQLQITNDYQNSEKNELRDKLLNTYNPWPNYFKNYVQGMHEYFLVEEPEGQEYLVNFCSFRKFFTSIRLFFFTCVVGFIIFYIFT